MSDWILANISFGKDSLAMFYSLEHVDEVVFYDTGAEFQAIYSERDKMLPVFDRLGVKYSELKPKRPFFYDMLAKPVRRKDGTVQQGYGWCGGVCRWGTSQKTAAIERLAISRERQGYNVRIAIGIAYDERERIQGVTDPRKFYPLIDQRMTEADCLALCYARGHDWLEDGVRLYDVLDRVSCWCCRNKNLAELRSMAKHLPKYYEMLRGLENSLGQMKRNNRLAEAGPVRYFPGQSSLFDEVLNIQGADEGLT